MSDIFTSPFTRSHLGLCQEHCLLLKHDVTTTAQREEMESDSHQRYVDKYMIRPESHVACTLT
jgi:hypothetical protein